MFPFSKGGVAIPVTPLDSPLGSPTIMFRVRVMHILPTGSRSYITYCMVIGSKVGVRLAPDLTNTLI